MASLFDLILAKLFSAPIRPRLKQTTDLDDLATLIDEVLSSKQSAPAAYAKWVKEFLDDEKKQKSDFFESVEPQLRKAFGIPPESS